MGIDNINDALEEIEKHELVGCKLNIPVQNMPLAAEGFAILAVKYGDKPTYFSGDGCKEWNDYIDARMVVLSDMNLTKRQLSVMQEQSWRALRPNCRSSK